MIEIKFLSANQSFILEELYKIYYKNNEGETIGYLIDKMAKHNLLDKSKINITYNYKNIASYRIEPEYKAKIWDKLSKILRGLRQRNIIESNKKGNILYYKLSFEGYESYFRFKEKKRLQNELNEFNKNYIEMVLLLWKYELENYNIKQAISKIQIKNKFSILKDLEKRNVIKINNNEFNLNHKFIVKMQTLKEDLIKYNIW